MCLVGVVLKYCFEFCLVFWCDWKQWLKIIVMDLECPSTPPPHTHTKATHSLVDNDMKHWLLQILPNFSGSNVATA